MVKKEKVEEAAEEQTQADVIWDKIKDLDVELYALPPQKLASQVKRLKVAPDVVHLKLKAPALLPVLDEVLGKVKLDPGKRFDVSPQKDFTVISIVFDPTKL